MDTLKSKYFFLNLKRFINILKRNKSTVWNDENARVLCVFDLFTYMLASKVTEKITTLVNLLLLFFYYQRGSIGK